MQPETVLMVTRSRGNLAGVFEFDGDTSYFYFWRQSDDYRVLGAIHIATGKPDFGESDLDVRWYARDERVGLFVRNELWAAFDAETGTTAGGDYRSDERPILPPWASHGLGPERLDS